MTRDPNLTPHLPGRSELRLNAWLERFNQWPGALRKALILGISLIGGLLLISIVSAPLDLYSQCLFAALCFGLALLVKRMPGRWPILLLIVLS
ncbi:MAG: UDP-forming cellulose synthase catalytic subunit, partial [Pseudomonas sp.]